MDIRRILTRLRSKHATSSKFRGRTPLITQLSAAIQAGSSESTSGMPGAGRDKLVALQVLFERLERMSDIASRMNEAQELVGNIVKEAHEFSMATDLIAALEHSKIEPSLKQYLPEAMTKLGRYYAAVCELVSAARERKNHVFQNVHVEPCQVLVPADIEESSLGTRLLGVAPTLGHLPASRTGELADTLQKRMVEIAGHRAVHAEIQLLFFYELQPESPRPRIICSNKSACYLCNLFFQVHGGFCIPKTHGRIYDKWILPDWLAIPSCRQRELSIILELFKDTLDGRIKEVSMSKRKPYNHPNESNLQSPADYSSTELSAPLAQSSRSILLPRAVRFQEMKSITKLPGEAVLPSTQPRVPPEPPKPPHVTGTADVHPETFTALDTVKLANNKRENKSSLDLMSLVTLRQKHLPYSQILTLATPSLYVRIDKLFVILEFAEALSGRLFITKKGEWEPSKTVRIVDINDIPTTSELEVHCSQESNEVQILLQNQKAEIFHIKFVWGNAC
jgi:hypothetical protein